MINDIKSSSFAANTAISSSQESVNSGIEKAAATSAGIAAVRDSFQMVATQSSVQANTTMIAQPATIDEPGQYLNHAIENGRTISSYVQNQDLLPLMSDPNLDFSAGVKEFNDGFTKSIKDALQGGVRAGEKRKDLQEKIKEKQEEIKKLQEELEEASDKNGWDDFVNFLGSDSGQGEVSMIADLSRYTAIKKDDD